MATVPKSEPEYNDHGGDYAPIPTQPPQQPPQFYLVLPYSPAAHRRRRKLLRGLTVFSSVLLLAAVVYLLFPSDPDLKLVRVNLHRIHFRTKPHLSVDLSLAVRVRVRNPDFYSMDYDSLNVWIGYRGEMLGFATSEGGHVAARGSSYVNTMLVLNGVEVLSNVFYLIEDLARGSVPFDTVTEVKGNVGLVLFELPLQAKLACEINVDVGNQTIDQQSCRPV